MTDRSRWMPALDALAWMDVDRAIAAVEAISPETLADRVFVGSAAARIAFLKPYDAPSIANLRWQANETRDPALAAFALLPSEQAGGSSAVLTRAERAWSLVHDQNDDPLALLVQSTIATANQLWSQVPERGEAIANTLWSARASYRPMGVCATILRTRSALASRRLDEARQWIDRGTALAGDARGNLVATLFVASSYIHWQKGDTSGAVDAAAEVMKRDANATGSGYFDLLRTVGRVGEAIDGLERAVRRRPNNLLARCRLAMAYLAAETLDPSDGDDNPPVGPCVTGPFDVLEPIGTGANAVVYSARHHETGASVALKVLRSERPGHDDLEDEARVLARMRHPNILPVWDLGTVSRIEAAHSSGRLEAGATWMAMERITGGTLATRMRALSAGAIRELVESLLHALGHAHGAGVLHLDLKPANILVRRGTIGNTPLLADFGVYSLVRRSTRGRVAGTPAYMAPEQWRGRLTGLSPATDLYALGAIVFELFTGRRAFQGPTIDAYRNQHCIGPRPELASQGPLQDWLDRMLAVGTEDRFPSAAEALSAFRALPAVERSPEGQRSNAASQLTFAATIDFDALQGPDEDVDASISATGLAPPTDRVPVLPDVARPVVSPLCPPSLALEASDAGSLPGLAPIQHHLWAEMHTTSGGRVLRLTGPGGHTITRWLARAAREAGWTSTWSPDAAVVHPPGGRPRLTVGVRVPAPDAELALPVLPVQDLEHALLDRLPLTAPLVRAIAERASGDIDVAFSLLESIVPHLQRDGLRWGSSSEYLLDRQAHSILAERARTLVREAPDLARELSVLALADVTVPTSLRHPGLTGMLDTNDHLVPHAAVALKDCVELDSRDLDAALTLATRPSVRARILALMGEAQQAMTVLLDQFDRDLDTHAHDAARALLEQAAALDCELPAQYHLQHARYCLHAEGDRTSARAYAQQACRDPQVRPVAEALLAVLDDTAVSDETMARLANPARRSAALVQRARVAFFDGDVDGAWQHLQQGSGDHGHPYADAFRLWWFLPSQPHEKWLDEAHALLTRDSGSARARIQSLLGSAHAMWGQLTSAERHLAGLPPTTAVASHLLLDIARDDGVAAQKTLIAGPQTPIVKQVTWAWAAFWWLEADAPEDRWSWVQQEWAARPGATVVAWLLDRAAARAPGARARSIRETRDRVALNVDHKWR